MRSGGRLWKFQLVARQPRANRFGGLRGKEEVLVKKRCASCECQSGGKDADRVCCGDEPQPPPICAHEPPKPRRPETIRPAVRIVGPNGHDSHP